VQLPLQRQSVQTRGAEPFPRCKPDAYTRSQRIRPRPYISCEQMFPRHPTSKLAQRALGALRVAGSFLLLEDDCDVDWEVGQDEPARVPHPHRARLRGGCVQRRAGQLPARSQACLSPVGRVAPARHGARTRRADADSAAGGERTPRTGRIGSLDGL